MQNPPKLAHEIGVPRRVGRGDIESARGGFGFDRPAQGAHDILDVGNPLGLLEASVVLGEAQYGDEFSSWLDRRNVE